MILVLGTSMLTLLVTVFVLRLYHGKANERVPTWLHSLVKYMATVTCQQTSLIKLERAIASDRKSLRYDVITNRDADNRKGIITKKEEIENHKNKLGFEDDANPVMRSMLNEMKKNRVETVSLLQSMLMEMRKDGGETSVAWTTVATIVDKFFAVVFLLVIIVVNIVTLFAIPNTI